MSPRSLALDTNDCSASRHSLCRCMHMTRGILGIFLTTTRSVIWNNFVRDVFSQYCRAKVDDDNQSSRIYFSIRNEEPSHPAHWNSFERFHKWQYLGIRVCRIIHRYRQRTFHNFFHALLESHLTATSRFRSEPIEFPITSDAPFDELVRYGHEDHATEQSEQYDLQRSTHDRSHTRNGDRD